MGMQEVVAIVCSHRKNSHNTTTYYVRLCGEAVWYYYSTACAFAADGSVWYY